ncbi:pseudouridine synthase [Butyrivibrio sp. YAB3001]|uniref:pseudouridine synthase n=1 Tax=Butyrivibrio sp. YAB3001 TaxID=1520812 RepID=UPI0008F666C4|nr:pseudouridine synthase [Butyrivibrio sp. YAB3001]SFB67183.1 23S rRNA pseudouridine2604 synthase [Butyrivibrio sp. YAB3001]
MRLNKFIAACGICSRRDADKLIMAGRVKVNGKIADTGLQVSETDEVLVDDKKIGTVNKHVVLAYYKPVGVVCTERDAHAEKTVISEIKYDRRVTYAGRLDKDSEGLLLLTDDGNLINAMMRGANMHEKEYEVEVDKNLTGDFLKKLSQGVYLEELDKTTRPCSVTRTGKKSFKIIITQGLNRQIRRMCAALGAEVVSLKRIRVMTVTLSDMNIKAGEYKVLSNLEMQKLYRAAGLELQ